MLKEPAKFVNEFAHLPKVIQSGCVEYELHEWRIVVG